MSNESHFSGIKIVEVRVRNFRCLQEVNITLDWITVLVGENNSGKTSFLEAIFTAIGSGRHTISVEDIYIGPFEKKVPRDRFVTIDLLMRPTDNYGNFVDAFPQGSYWVELFGEGISQDDDEREFAAIRTQIKWNGVKGEYEKDRKFLIDWSDDPKDWDKLKTKSQISSSQIEPLALHLLDAKRDIKESYKIEAPFGAN